MMAAQSTNKYDVFIWIEKVIRSCDTPQQLICSIKLCRFFQKTYKDNELYNILRDIEGTRWGEYTLSKKETKQLLKG